MLRDMPAGPNARTWPPGRLGAWPCASSLSRGPSSRARSSRLTRPVLFATAAVFCSPAPRALAGNVCAWGANNLGQIGDGTLVNCPMPKDLELPNGVVATSAGGGFTLTLKSDGTVWSWGANDHGQLGNNSLVNSPTPVQVSGLQNVIAVSAGSWHALALRADRTVWGWGWNPAGQVGDGSLTDRTVPVQVKNLANVIAVSAGSLHSLALRSDGTIWAWGSGVYGQLGNNSQGPNAHSAVPVQTLANNLTYVMAIAAGGLHSLAVDHLGNVWSWGDNRYGQLGVGATGGYNPAPVPVPGVTDAIAVSGGGTHSLAVLANGKVWAWGDNSVGQLGDGTTTSRATPAVIPGLDSVLLASAGGYHSAALRSDDTVWAWGFNNYSQIGDGTTTNRLSPCKVSGPASVISVSAGLGHTLAVEASTAWGWGLNVLGQLGDGTSTERDTPVQVKDKARTGLLTDVVAVCAGENCHFSQSLAVKADGTVWAWGQNSNGQLGDGTTSESYNPVQVKDTAGTGVLTDAVSVSGGGNHSLALKKDGTVWAWGYNAVGQLGDGTSTSRRTPVQVKDTAGTGVLTDVAQVSAGQMHSLALKTDGTVWAWGANEHGQLGDGTYLYRLTPVHVPGLVHVVAVSAGGYGSLAVTAEGTVYEWGPCHALGGIQYPDPRRVEGLVGVISASRSENHSLALSVDGSVRAWGRNADGELGDGTTIDRWSPVQVKGLSGVKEVSAAAGHSVALKGDGTVWAWGGNALGQLGDNTTTPRLTPVQVKDTPGTAVLTSVLAVSAGCDHNLVVRGVAPAPLKLEPAHLAEALRIAGGLHPVAFESFGVYNVVPGSTSAFKIDMLDVVRIARKIAGLEPNP